MPVLTRLAITVLVGLAFVSCDWQPLARPVQPELVVEGDYLIAAKLDAAERYVLLRSLDDTDLEFRIVDLKLRKSCALPDGTRSAGVPLLPSPSFAASVPPFLISVTVQLPGEEDAQLYTSDPNCNIAGPYGIIGSGPVAVTLDVDQRGAYLYGNGRSTLFTLDPWTPEYHDIATGVRGYSQVARLTDSNGPVGPQALWILEGGKLTQRTFAGELLLSMGTDVTRYDQAIYDTVRIAYVDGDDVYEAAGPDFQPFLVAEAACQPFYYGTTLNLYSPCSPPQLVRFDLLTGTIQEFPEGVTWSYADGGTLLEYALLAGQDVLYATAASGERIQVMPTLWDVQVIDRNTLAGISADRRFGVWSASSGFTPLFEGVVKLSPFVDIRASKFLWLMLHDEVDGLGRLSVFDQNDFKLQTLAVSVPSKKYSVEYLEQVPEPIVVTIEDVADGATTGALRARLLSGELPSSIDESVSSYEVISAPLPGLIYTITEGLEKHGLWFAAL